MKTIWKYQIPLTDNFALNLPVGAKFLHLNPTPQYAGNSALFDSWFEVETDAETVETKFLIRGTGHELPINAGDYLVTFITGYYVWHLYSEIK